MFKSIIELLERLKTEQDCIDLFVKLRWDGKIKCPFKDCFRSANRKVYEFKDKKRFQCSCCNKIFSYKTGTVFENSKIAMKKWFMCIYLHTAHKKGISSLQLSRDIDVTQKTAWFMLGRIRFIEGRNFFNEEFNKTVEVDEAYLGGKAESKLKEADKERVKDKAIVFGLVERESGKVKSYKVDSNQYCDLGEKIFDNVKIDSTIVSDEASSYRILNKYYSHKTVNHSNKEYVRIDESRVSFKIHTNTIEGYWSLLKRGINGIYHWVSKKHLDRYLDEFNFRYNSRELRDGERFCFLLGDTSGRLKYKKLIAKM